MLTQNLKKTTNHKTLRWANFVLSRNVGYSKRVCATLTIQFWYISTDIGLCIFPVKRRHEKEIKGTHKRMYMLQEASPTVIEPLDFQKNVE